MDEYNRNQTIAAVILAAGRSSRMQYGQEGFHKLLLPLGRGTVLSHVIAATLASEARPIILVLGYQSAQVRASLRDTIHGDVIIIENTAYAQGMSTSLHQGIRVLMSEDGSLEGGLKRWGQDTGLTAEGSMGEQGRHEARPLRVDDSVLRSMGEQGRHEAPDRGKPYPPLRGCGGALVLLGDQPLITPALLNRLIELKYSTGKRIIAPFYNGRRGNPVLFDAGLFPELLTITGDEGGRSVVERHCAEVERLDVDASQAWYDVDTWDGYQQVLHTWQEQEK